MGLIFDTLMIPDEDGTLHPFLLESMEPNAEFTEWTLTPRPGVSFHDGTPFDAAAVKDNIDRFVTSGLTGPALGDIDTVTQVGETVVVTTKVPWATLPIFFAGQTGYIASPTWTAGVDAGTADSNEPVGTGPFAFADYNAGNNFRAVRNPDYWLSDADGNQYPYLDEVEVLVQVDNQTRTNSIISGEVDVSIIDSGLAIAALRDEDSVELYELDDRKPVTYLMLNVADPDSPVGDLRVRQAMAMGIDQETRNQARSAGVFEIANGPFSPGSPGYLEDTGYPTYDPDGARELVDEYEAENGPIEITYNATSDEEDLQTAELTAEFLGEVGIDVNVNQVEQSAYITDALQGNFETIGWRLHGGFEVDVQNVWWNSENAEEIGALSLNFGRFTDEVIDENLAIIRGSADPAERQEAAEAINRRFGEQLYNLWADWITWGTAHQAFVHNVGTGLDLPEGATSADHGWRGTGVVNLSNLWLDQ